MIVWSIYSAYALAFFYGGILVSQGLADVGIVINVFLSILIGSFSIAMLAPEATAISKGKAAAAKLYDTIDRQSAIDSSSTAGLKPSSVKGHISFENVKFHYPSLTNVPILKGFSAEFPAGASVALVGASGSGKSTIVSLVERFYDPISGRVLVDGVDVKDLNIKWLRQQIGKSAYFLANDRSGIPRTNTIRHYRPGQCGARSYRVSMGEREPRGEIRTRQAGVY